MIQSPSKYELKTFCKVKNIHEALYNNQSFLEEIAYVFESLDEEINEISTKAAELASQIEQLNETIKERINK